MLGAGGLERTGFGPWLEGYGVELGEDIVVDPTNPLPFYSAETFFANEYENHPITEALEDANYPVIFSLARSVGTLPSDGDAGIQVTQLVRSSPDAWGETNLPKLDAVAKDDADVAGPVGLGVAVEIEAGARRRRRRERRIAHRARRGRERRGGSGGASSGARDPQPPRDREPPSAAGMKAMERSRRRRTRRPRPGAGDDGRRGPAQPSRAPTAMAQEPGRPATTAERRAAAAARRSAPRPGRLVVFGDSDFASNAQLASVGNPTLFLNALNWLVERENLLAIPAKKADQIQLNLTRRDLSTIYLIVLVALPLASLSAGVAVYLRRRR